MDGVPHLTQPPIAPGESFVYEFDVPDAGTYWYHPHQRSFEQVGRGLYGPLIVEEREPIQVDRDVTWVLDDWRLLPDAQISDDFGNFMDSSHNGRVGNTVTVNGRILETFAVRAGERVRLRLINAANARIFGLEFQDHRPMVIALDGQPVEPHEPAGGRVVLGPAMRADLVIDMSGPTGRALHGHRSILSRPRIPAARPRLRGRAAAARASARCADAPCRQHHAGAGPGDGRAPRDRVRRRHDGRHDGTDGGMMEGMMGGMMRGMQHSGIWAINGVAATGHVMEPFLTLRRGRSYVLAMHNDTAWHHPMHLHGHAFRVIARDGRPTRYQEWQDTVLMAPHERVDIAFVADNPGDWMFHCHILEHQAAGMMGVIRVA